MPALLLLVTAAPDLRETLAERLGGRADELTWAEGEEQAIALVAERTPDAILVDARLGGVLDRLRADVGLDGVPVLLLAGDEDAVDALRRGAHDVLRAPFDAAELSARVDAALRVKALHDALVEANARLAQQALTDDLTGLANRRHGAHELERAVALCVRHGRELGLVRVDVDHFKAINDGRGHQVGDEVLAEVARRLQRAGRGGDELARWGGDEFVAILPDTDREGAARAAERLRASVAAAPIAGLDVTISVGWAHWSGDTPDDLLARADRALYQAKDAGRDTVRP
jgi:two-component system cell cycle response regulator